jgi:beta-glucuronidase
MDLVAGGASGYLGPRGTAFYRTQFQAPAAGLPVRLQFQACSFYCRIFVNGKEVGDHRAGGYVAFFKDVASNLLKPNAENELFVLADNRYNHTTAPMHTGGDFWHYGGLMRSVELHTMAADNAPVLWRAYVLPTGADMYNGVQVAKPDSVDITLQLSSGISDGQSVDFTMAFDDGAAMSSKGISMDGGKVQVKGVKVPNPTLWSPATPNLHTVTVTFNGGSVTERFGLRTFGVDKDTARLTINGDVVKLVGWNHHTQWPVTAASPTDDQIDADIALLKKGNANYVRGAHYPHDPRMIDRLDEAGIMFWSETIGPSVSSANTQDWDFFMKYQLMQLNEMLDNAFNHAAVFTWGWFNEGPSNDIKACPAYGACANVSKTRDPTRFTTWADDKDLRGLCYEHASLIAFNNYPGWYNQFGDKSAPKRFWTEQAAGVRAGLSKSGAAGTLGKPMVISETGAGGIFEWSNNDTDVKWTLNYQTEIIASDVDVAINNENISGITLWHFYDFKVDNCGAHWPCKGGGQENNTHCEYDHPPPETFEELASKGPPNCTYIEINNRPGGENHKGTVDFWRRPKPIFKIVASKYKAANAIAVAAAGSPPFPACVHDACTVTCVPPNASDPHANPRGNCCGNHTSVCAYDTVFGDFRCQPPSPLFCSGSASVSKAAAAN